MASFQIDNNLDRTQVQIKVILIITSLNVGGAENMLLKLLRNIDREKFNVSVISMISLGDIGPHIQSLKIPVHVLGMNPGLPNPFMIVYLALLLRKKNPDVIHTWMYHADLLGGISSRIAGLKALAWGIRHADLSQSANKRTTLWVVRMCARLSSWIPRKILVNSQVARIAHEAIGYAANKMVVIPNGFDLERFVPSPSARIKLRSELGLDSSTSLVGVIGRFHPQKNQMGFVQVMAELQDIQPNLHFVLAGLGVDADNHRLVSAIRDAGVSGACHLLGPRTDIPHLMAALDILALPSVGEAFPNVVGEAMACEVSCVVTDVGDSAWIVGNTGRVVPAGDMSGMALAIHDLLMLPADQRAALGLAARERVGSMFEIGTVVKQFEAFYESLASNAV